MSSVLYKKTKILRERNLEFGDLQLVCKKQTRSYAICRDLLSFSMKKMHTIGMDEIKYCALGCRLLKAFPCFMPSD